jgi:hypothetical protein
MEHLLIDAPQVARMSAATCGTVAPRYICFGSLAEFENACIFRTLAEKMRIMATMPQLPRRKSNKQRKKNLVRSNRWLAFPDFLESTPPAELKDCISPFEGTFFARTLLGTGRVRCLRADL